MIDQGVDAICVLANFSEQFLLTDEERDRLTALCLTHVAGRVPVVVTCSHFSTRIAAERGRRAASLGASMLMLMPPYHGVSLRADENGILAHFDAVAEAARIPIMVQDAPLSGVQLSVAFLVRLAKSTPLVNSYKIEVPGAAAKLRALIAAGGDAIVGPFDGEESVTLMADLDAGALGTMPSALLPDLIKVVLTHYFSGRRARSGRDVRADSAADQFREPPVRPAREQDGHEGRRRDQERRREAPARAVTSPDAGGPARTGGRRESAGAPVGTVALPSSRHDLPVQVVPLVREPV